MEPSRCNASQYHSPTICSATFDQRSRPPTDSSGDTISSRDNSHHSEWEEHKASGGTASRGSDEWSHDCSPHGITDAFATASPSTADNIESISWRHFCCPSSLPSHCISDKECT